LLSRWDSALSPQPDGTTRFDMREEYSGLMLAMIGRSIPDLQPSFNQFAQGLKRHAETREAATA
jgi:hypothetical protein